MMRNGGRRRALAAVLAIAVLGSFLGACSGIPNPVGFLGGGKDKKKPEIEGKRQAVLALEETVNVDPEAAKTPVELPPAHANTDWPQPGGRPSNDMGHLQASLNFKRVWSTRAGDGSDKKGRLIASPILADGKIFVRDARADVIAFDARTGKRLWSVDLTPDEKKIRDWQGTGGGVAYAPGRVFASSGFGFLVALDANSGAELWRTDVGAGMRTSPTYQGGRVFVTTFDNQLFALDATSGSILWTHRSYAEDAVLMVSTSPAVDPELVVVPYSSGEIYGLDPATGRSAWSDSLTRTGHLTALSAINDIAGRPVIDRGLVFAISHAGRLVAIDARLGQRLWTHNLGGTQTPWVAGDYVFVLTDDSKVYCLERTTGKVHWIHALQAYKNEKDRKKPITWSGPLLISGNLLLVSSNGKGLLLSPETGEVKKEVKLPEDILLPPIVAGQGIYILTDGADLLAYR